MPRVMIAEPHLLFRVPPKRRPRTEAIVVHHIGAMPKNLAPADIDADRINDWHRANGWAGIGYHFVVRHDGFIERGRSIGDTGSHCLGHNDSTLGVCVVGDFSAALPCPDQLDSLAGLLADLCEAYRLDPGAETIVGHRDRLPAGVPYEEWVNKHGDCPGAALYGHLPALRAQVRKLCGK